MNRGRLILSLLLLTLLVVAAWQWWMARTLSARIATNDAQAARLTQRADAWRAQAEGTHATANRPLARPSAPGASENRLDAGTIRRPSAYLWSDVSESAWVPKKYLAPLGIRALTMDTNQQWRIADELAPILGLTAEERTGLDQARAHAMTRYWDLARTHFQQVLAPTPTEEAQGLWRVQYQVRAFPAELAALRQDFAAATKTVLPGEKAQYFASFLAQNTRDPFSPFGAKELSILCEFQRTTDEQWALQITETGTDRNRPIKCGQTTTQRLTATNLPPYWRGLIQMPPE